MPNFSIVWKLRPKGAVTFRRDVENVPCLGDALKVLMREEPGAYVVEAYVHKPVDPYALEQLYAHLEKKAVAEGWRSTGD